MSTKSGNARNEMLLVTETGNKLKGIDEFLTTACLERSIGEMNLMREKAANVRTQFVSALVCNAVFEMDVDAIAQIAERIDGTVPEKEHRDGYANILGNAIEDVMEYPTGPSQLVYETDPAIIAIAKVLIYVAMKPCGSNPAKRRERAKAIEIVLKRTGGKRVEPVREAVTVDYIEPTWMQPLPEGSE